MTIIALKVICQYELFLIYLFIFWEGGLVVIKL